MSASDLHLDRLVRLEPSHFEDYVCDAIAELTGARVYHARSGYQGGLDGRVDGNTGACIECKRYTSGRLSDRELLGEVHEASRNGCDLWILAATCPVSDQTAKKLNGAAADLGLMVLILDCPQGQTRPLELLALGAPRSAKRHLGLSGSDLRRLGQRDRKDEIDKLKAQIDTPLLSLEQLQARLWQNYDEIVKDVSRFRELGVRPPMPSGKPTGSFDGYVRRRSVEDTLNSWFDGEAAQSGRPAVLLGDEGVGKSLAALHWLHGRAAAGDLVFVVRSGFPVATDDPYELLSGLIKSLFGESADRWRKRLMAFFSTATASRINTIIYLDGINEQPEAPWLKLIEALQAGLFRGKLRILLSCRPWPYRYRHRSIETLDPPPFSIPVGLFDEAELREILLLHGRRLNDFPTEMHPLLARPRLMSMALRNEVALKAAGEYTSTRLFWEDWRDRINAHRNIINENQFRAALTKLASALDRYQRVSELRMDHADLARALESSQFFSGQSSAMEQSYSEIVDGGLARLDDDMSLSLDPVFAAMALGLELRLLSKDRGEQEYALLKDFARQTLEPWGGADFGAHVAHFAIWASVEVPTPVAVVSALLGLWLEQQNFAASHYVDASIVVGKRSDAAFEVAKDVWFASPDKAALALQRAFERPLSPAYGDGSVRKRMVSYVRDWIGRIAIERLLADEEGDRILPEEALARLSTKLGRDLQIGDAFEIVGETVRLVEEELSDGQNAATLALDILAATGAVDLASIVRKTAVVASIAYPEDMIAACGRLLRRLEPEDRELTTTLYADLVELKRNGSDAKLGPYDTLAFLLDLPSGPSTEPLHPLVAPLWPAASPWFKDRLSDGKLLAKLDTHLLFEALLEPDAPLDDDVLSAVRELAAKSRDDNNSSDFSAIIDAAVARGLLAAYRADDSEPASRYKASPVAAARRRSKDAAGMIAKLAKDPTGAEADQLVDALLGMCGDVETAVRFSSGKSDVENPQHVGGGPDIRPVSHAFMAGAFATAPDRLDSILEHLTDRTAPTLDVLLDARPSFLLSLLQAAMTLERPSVWALWRLARPIAERLVLLPDERYWYFDLPFQAGDSVESRNARDMVLELADTEASLLDLVLSVRHWKRQDWLEDKLASDLSSGAAWRACRAMVLSGMMGKDLSDITTDHVPAPEWLAQASLAGFRYWRREERMLFWMDIAKGDGSKAAAARRVLLADSDRRFHALHAGIDDTSGKLGEISSGINGSDVHSREFGYFAHFLGIPPHPWLPSPGAQKNWLASL